MPHTTKPTAVDHALVSIYQTQSLAEFTALLDTDPLREVSDYMTVPLTTLQGDFATDTNRFDDARKALIGEDPASVLRYAEYEAMMAKQPDFVGKYQPLAPANEPVDFDRPGEPGDPLQFLVNGVNPGGYIGMWDDLRHLMHYQKVLWWHHYTWMLASQGIKTHTFGTHDFCTTLNTASKSAAALDVLKVRRWSTSPRYWRWTRSGTTASCRSRCCARSPTSSAPTSAAPPPRCAKQATPA